MKGYSILYSEESVYTFYSSTSVGINAMMDYKRRKWYIDYFREHAFLGLKDASISLGASVSTIRRDFRELESENLVKWYKGGVKAALEVNEKVPPFAMREAKYSEEKDAIAQRAVRLLSAGDVLIVDGGTTTYALAHRMPDIPLRIFTVSIPFALAVGQKFHEMRHFEIFLSGGFFDPTLGILSGADALASISKIHAQWSFIAVDGINAGGITNSSHLSTETKRKMIEQGEKVVVLADHSKIGKIAMLHLCRLEEIDMLITDEFTEKKPIVDEIRRSGVEVITVLPKTD